jgi:TPP-dependent 2-oxoacid decarboxylase
MKRVSDQIADWLVAQGIEQVFTVTGGGAMFLNQSLGGHEKLKTTFMHHEQACAMAAEGYARIAGKPAVVMLTTGPGSVNALNGVYGAFTDSIPMIVLSGQIKRETCISFNDAPNLRQLGDQEGPTIAMASPVCKYARLVRSENDIETMLQRGYIRSAWPGMVGYSLGHSTIHTAHPYSFSFANTYHPRCIEIKCVLSKYHRKINRITSAFDFGWDGCQTGRGGKATHRPDRKTRYSIGYRLDPRHH